nr:organic solute transporter Ost-alpha [Tanacetum cinerariifolium]
MEKRVEEIEGSVRSLAEGQQAIVNQINDLFSQLKVCIEEVSKRGNDGESSNSRGQGPRYGPNANYTTKPLKLDFSSRCIIFGHIFGTIILILCGPTVSLLVAAVSRLDRGEMEMLIIGRDELDFFEEAFRWRRRLELSSFQQSGRVG